MIGHRPGAMKGIPMFCSRGARGQGGSELKGMAANGTIWRSTLAVTSGGRRRRSHLYSRRVSGKRDPFALRGERASATAGSTSRVNPAFGEQPAGREKVMVACVATRPAYTTREIRVGGGAKLEALRRPPVRLEAARQFASKQFVTLRVAPRIRMRSVRWTTSRPAG